jgi:hypothetical protein
MLIDAKGQVTPACSKSHINYCFDIRHPIGELKIQFAYHPKRLEDIERSKALIVESLEMYSGSDHVELEKANWEKFMPLTNLITLSVDDPERHRGAGHRHDPDQLLTISELQASPGFISGPLIEGMWKVTLSLHGIVSEECSYELKVWTEGKS